MKKWRERVQRKLCLRFQKRKTKTRKMPAKTKHCTQVCDAQEKSGKLQKLWLAFTVIASLVLLTYMLVCMCVHH